MFPHPARIIILIALATAALSGFAARGVLQADGILRVKGVDPSTTSITVVPGGAASYTLPRGTMRFMLLLPLDDVYLISVSGEGCPTKEIYVDARVPVEMHAADFTFPFMVTLEHVKPERMFAYAGPVGFVRYLHPLTDFGYETEYVVRVDEGLNLRMEAFRTTGVDPRVFQPVLAARVVNLPRGEYNSSSLQAGDAELGSVAPVASEVGPKVHTLAALPMGGILVAPIRVVNGAGPQESAEVPLPDTLIMRSEDPAAGSGRMRSLESAIEPEAANEAPVPMRGAMVVVAWRSERTDELITEARMLTRIVRFSTQFNGMIEFRKVTHAFGAVYYFQGDQSITERAFEAATAPVVDSSL